MSHKARPPENFDEAVEFLERLQGNIQTVIRGKADEVKLILVSLAQASRHARHLLLHDVPGTAKTVLVRTLVRSIEGATFARIQGTPDLQPNDVTGLSIFNQRTLDFEFRAGPIFHNFILFDEINRTMPKTQSALLEAMAEGQVTIDGVTRELPDPFMVFATENPIESEGTFPLPEAQLDRFMVRMQMGYPAHAHDELQMLEDQEHGHPLERIQPVLTLSDIRTIQKVAETIHIDEELRRWNVDLVRYTRERPDEVEFGASPRGTIALRNAARARALLHGRHFVTSEDIRKLFVPVLGHRIIFKYAFTHTIDAFAEQCFAAVPEPKRAD